MSLSPENIFNYTHAKPNGETDEFNENTYSLITATLSELMLYTGCLYSKISHRTLLFGSEFKTLSVLCELTWRDCKFTAQVSCPYTEFLTHNTIDEAVRLYTKHPLTNRTIHTYISDIWNFKQHEYVFRFLSQDFSWFSLNLDSIKDKLRKELLLDDDQSLVFNMESPHFNEVDLKGKEISLTLLKPIIRTF